MTYNNIPETLRDLLRQWRDEQKAAADADADFNWHLHDRELISIQNAIRTVYQQANDEAHASLSPDEEAEITNILNVVID